VRARTFKHTHCPNQHQTITRRKENKKTAPDSKKASTDQNFQTTYELLILDDIGYVKRHGNNESAGAVRTSLLTDYGKGSMLITSTQQISREWDSIFGDNMMTVAAIDD